MNLEQVAASIRNVPDFPKPGILFKDITTAMKDAEVLKFIADELYDYYKDKGITKVVGVESRGFVLGSILAYRLGAGFVLLRKPGKLPSDTFKIDYDLEYGTDTIEIQKDAILPQQRVVIVDDLLATGGTLAAAVELLSIVGAHVTGAVCIIELEALGGRKKISIPISSLISYED